MSPLILRLAITALAVLVRARLRITAASIAHLARRLSNTRRLEPRVVRGIMLASFGMYEVLLGNQGTAVPRRRVGAMVLQRSPQGAPAASTNVCSHEKTRGILIRLT